MALTPVEVESTQFRVAFRGYAIDEVDAFLDRVQAELSRLLTEQAPAAAAPVAPASASEPSTEGQEAALRTLLLAQRTADQAVAEARAEAEQIRTAAREEADAALASARQEAETARTSASAEAESTLTSAREEAEGLRTSARTEAEETLTSARVEAERLLSSSRAEAEGLDEQIAQRLEAALGDLDRRRSRLEVSIEQLQAFEREYRTRLRAYLEGQLRELDGGSGPDDDGIGVPVGAGGAAVGRPAAGAVRVHAADPDQPRPAAAPDPAAPTTDR